MWSLFLLCVWGGGLLPPGQNVHLGCPLGLVCYHLCWSGEGRVKDPVKGGSPGSPIQPLLENGKRAMVFSMAFDWNEAGIFYKFSVLLGCLFPDPLAKESRLSLSLSLSFGFLPLVFPSCWLGHHSVCDTLGQKENLASSL